MAPLIVEALGKHHAYWEPFAGSMAVLMAKPACRMETVNDLHGDLIHLARTVKDPKLGPALYRRLRRVLASSELMEDAKGRLSSPPPENRSGLDRAEDYFLISWLARSGFGGTPLFNTNVSKRFTASGGSPATRFVAAVNSIPAWRERLRNVLILSECGISLCERIEDDYGVVLYADPPYFVKNGRYVHDFADADHARLAESLLRFKKTRVVVSYYADPRLAELYPGWTVVDCARSKHMVSAGRRDKENNAVAPEVLLINGAAAGGKPSLFGGLP